MRASIAHGIRPSALILGRDSRKPWDKWDLLLAEAYQIMEAERCGQCGLPRWICHNEDSDIWFDIDQDTCFAKRELEELQDRQPKDYKAPTGTQMKPTPMRFSKGEFDLVLREEFYMAEYKAREDNSAEH